MESEVDVSKMEIQQLQKEKDGKIILKIKKTSPEFVNMIRREVIESVPTMTIDTVEFKENSSAVYDEILAHRLGLVPLTTDLKSYNIPAKCKCEGEGCARCQLTLTLKAKGPCNVYASDLKSKDPKVKPVFPKTLITKLLKGQELQLMATAVLGQGKDHMKFAPGLPFYHSSHSFKQLKNIENSEEVRDNCPSGVFKAEKGKLVPVDEGTSHLWETCLPFVPEGSIEVQTDSSEVIFILESWGSLSPKEILVQACDGFQETLNEFEEAMKK